jgi:hypothetical protein
VEGFTFRENYVNSLDFCTGNLQLKQGYFLKYHTNRASEVPSKAVERDLFDRIKSNQVETELIEPLYTKQGLSRHTEIDLL